MFSQFGCKVTKKRVKCKRKNTFFFSLPSESELVDLFGVFIPKLRNTIQILYKEELVRPYEAERTIRQKRNLHLTVYNMEVVMQLAFRLNSYQARAVRKELMERISRDHKPFEVVMTAVKGGKK